MSRLEMEQLPLVSIITPSYNPFPFIKETVNSVQIQDYSKIEHIVIDGGSTDGTVEFLRQQSHLTWISEPDRGQSHAINKGFQSAKGEIIGWLNADDTYQRQTISIVVRFLLENTDVDLVYSDVQFIDGESQPIGIARSQPFELFPLLFSNFIKQPTVFMRSQVVNYLHGVNESLHYVMDREFWLRVGIAGFKLHYLENHVLANFRMCPNTKSYEHSDQFRSEWLRVLENSSMDPSFRMIPDSIRRKALKNNKAQEYMAKMKKAAKQKKRKAIIQHLFLAIIYDWKMIINRGTWIYFLTGLLGREVKRHR